MRISPKIAPGLKNLWIIEDAWTEGNSSALRNASEEALGDT